MLEAKSANLEQIPLRISFDSNGRVRHPREQPANAAMIQDQADRTGNSGLKAWTRQRPPISSLPTKSRSWSLELELSHVHPIRLSLESANHGPTGSNNVGPRLLEVDLHARAAELAD